MVTQQIHNKLKTFGLIIVVLIAGVLFAENALLSRSLKAKEAELETSSLKVTQLVAANQSMEETVAFLENMAEQERKAAELADMERQKWRARATKAQQQIHEDITDAKCADLPIPGADRWVYYNTHTSGNTVQAETD